MTASNSGSAAGWGGTYFLAMIGSAVWFWQQAEGFWEHVGALLQALVWPAFLIYDVFAALNG
ncbi:hypothetical protein [Demequina zhanjiangensis]|uniref:Uncharacterized protein n=1 Tax=Demequina zhanjiangensis TaxID=3051659 RepID=A0ABT8FYN2_9MICO|nr:hypothetical protein [Demequina sp. SYSU T00b26]MDN4471819.1 hypothetical protein [Demequina sp. SYSU T00b26]